MTLHWPQLTILALTCIGLGIDAAKHGELKTGRHNATTTLIATAINLAILYFGGFFGGG